MIFLIAGGAFFLAYIISKESTVSGRLYAMNDVDPDKQGGNYSRDYDIYFETAADEYGVPFALMKALAITESSLRPSAFRDESDTGPNRQGWGSRGLLQLLWWPGSERFKKYGYSDKDLGVDAVRLFDPHVNIDIGAQLIRDNIHASKGNLRDVINMHNAGVKESVRKAPNGYVDKVMAKYNTLMGVS